MTTTAQLTASSLSRKLHALGFHPSHADRREGLHVSRTHVAGQVVVTADFTPNLSRRTIERVTEALRAEGFTVDPRPEGIAYVTRPTLQDQADAFTAEVAALTD